MTTLLISVIMLLCLLCQINAEERGELMQSGMPDKLTDLTIWAIGGGILILVLLVVLVHIQ